MPKRDVVDRVFLGKVQSGQKFREKNDALRTPYSAPEPAEYGSRHGVERETEPTRPHTAAGLRASLWSQKYTPV